MRQGIFTPNRPAISTLRNLLIFLLFVYTPRGLMGKAVASELIDRWFESWSRQIFFLFFFIVNFLGREVDICFSKNLIHEYKCVWIVITTLLFWHSITTSLFHILINDALYFTRNDYIIKNEMNIFPNWICEFLCKFDRFMENMI